MKKGVWLLSGLLFAFLLHTTATRASHIAGGNIEFVAADTPGQFRLSLNLYIDDASRGADATIDSTIIVSIFRSSDNQLMGDYKLKLVRKLILVYANPACARTRGLQTSEVRYSALVKLDPASFSDPAGYYIVWEKCCRNKNVVNIKSPEASGMIYYLTFPPLLKNGTFFKNSSPVFLTPNPEYICVNKPFTLTFRATDTDGDELRYSLTTPYNDNIYKPYRFNNSPASPPYRLLNWMPGFSAQQAITGNPSLSIDRASGILTVRPDKLGLFAFTVLCEEYRQGVKIGEVRRDHQILVVDCEPQVPPKPTLTAIDPTGKSPLLFCEGSAVLLQTDTDSLFNYQWQHDGYNLPGQTKFVLKTVEPGDYKVVKSFARMCTRDTTSEVFRLVLKPSSKASILTPDSVLCPTRPLMLTAKQQPDFRYQWQKNNKDIAGATSPVYSVSQAGEYTLKAYNTTTDCTSFDSVRVQNGPLQQVKLMAKTGQMLCEGSTLLASTAPDSTGFQYVWTHTGPGFMSPNQPTLTRVSAGDYAVTVTDSSHCAITSATVRINPRPKPLLDSLPLICGPTAPVVLLTASPPGGTLSGDGITGNRFDPAKAGVGKHEIRYAVTNEFGCKADTSRAITVLNLPTVDLGADRQVSAGGSVRLDGPTGQNLTYLWLPESASSSPNESSITIKPAQTTTYKLTVLTNRVCPVSDDVLVEVLPGLFVPTAFSPNGDGLNDTWALPGIDAFPQCSVRIFDRWGELIFQASPYIQPWDGTYRGQRVRAGVYPFVIRPAPDQPEQQGMLTVL